ncbi:hypothetical protein M422DRAFT_273498 [Sphaerobolus stellatus SS14]|uniref:Uncharacterized protein n=1 Tax=Sphaerobolus stellatus (strain SS14) TaxID=990650 RepID=A0A0C9T8Z0_SPHS4|nr:hypothetical protein M422DRAFT_273498 [Sphaerobolus stellatus SS14]
MKPTLIREAFAKTGIWPTNFSKFSNEDFTPSKYMSTTPSFPPSFPKRALLAPNSSDPLASSPNHEEAEGQLGEDVESGNNPSSSSSNPITLCHNACLPIISPVTLTATSDRVTKA